MFGTSTSISRNQLVEDLKHPGLYLINEREVKRNKVRFQYRFNETYILNHPRCLFIFGDNLARAGIGGQARACRFQVNTIGIPTKSEPHRYLTDSEEDLIKVYSRIVGVFAEIDELSKFNAFDFLVFPSDGIGTGLAKLEEAAPFINAKLQESLTNFVEYWY